MPPIELDINGGVFMRYVYPAIFYKDKKMSETYSVIFPDVPGAATCGYSLYEAIYMAEDALAGMLVMWEDFKAGKSDLPMSNRIVEPTPISEIVAEPDEYSSEAFVTLIKADTDVYRKILEELPPRDEDDENDDLEVPDTLAKELCRLAGIKYPFEDKK